MNQRDDMTCDARTALRTGVSVLGETPLHFAVKSGNLKLVQFLLEKGANTRARTYGEHATLPVEKVLNEHYNMRIANEIFKWELEHNIDTNDTPTLDKGLIHCSDSNVETIRNSVDTFLKTGEVTGQMSSMPMMKMTEEPRGVFRVEHLDNTLESKSRPLRACAGCGRKEPDMKKCGQCQSAHYCNSNCQKAHWKKHKKECRKM